MSHVDEGMLHAYLDGECSDREREEIEGHLAVCESCREQFSQAAKLSRQADDLLGELEPGALQAPPWREIESRAAARARTQGRRKWVGPSLAWAASIALAFGLGWFSNSFQALPSAPLLADRQETYRAAEAAEQPELAARRQDQPSVASEVGAGEVGLDAVERSVDRLEPAAPAEFEVQNRAEEPRSKAAPADAVGARKEAGRSQPAEGIPSERDERFAEAEQPATAEQAAGAPGAERLAAGQQLREPPAQPAPATAKTRASELKVTADDQRLRQQQPAAFAERRPIEAVTVVGEPVADSANEEKAPARFFAVQPDEAALWLGGELRKLPDLHLRRVEVLPGALVDGALAGLAAVRLAYEDAAGHEIVFIQQRSGESQKNRADESALTIDPSGINSYRWWQGGYYLILQGRVSGDSLRALADRVR